MDDPAVKSTKFVASLADNKTDPVLGSQVREHLVKKGLENSKEDFYNPEQAYIALTRGIDEGFFHLGIDPKDPSTRETPTRFAKMFVGELTKGLNYDFFPKCTSTPNGNVGVREAPWTQSQIDHISGAAPGEEEKAKPPLRTYEETVGAYDEAVIVKHIRTTSLCEHHLQTIDGFTHIAYLPRHKVIGLSKLARVTEFFAARPQIQERMTEQIYHALEFILGTPDVAVIVNAVHFCMRARGVKQPESWTQTNKMGGRFLEKESLRRELLDAIRKS